MSNAEKYLTKPHAYYATALSPAVGPFAQPDILLHRTQFIPWNDPQHAVHAALIKKRKKGRDHLTLDECVYDRELGLIHNSIFYYEKGGAFRIKALLPTPEKAKKESKIENPITVDWNRPTKADLDKLRRDRGCIIPLAEGTVYSLWEPRGNLPALTVSTIMLIPEAALTPDFNRPLCDLIGVKQNDTYDSDIVHRLRPSRDPELGHVSFWTFYVRSHKLFESLYEETQQSDIREAGLLWKHVSGEVTAAPGCLHVFPARPTKAEWRKQMKRFGLKK